MFNDDAHSFGIWFSCFKLGDEMCHLDDFFYVLINGSTPTSLEPSRGLKGGCSLSPLLFLIVVERLSWDLLEAKRKYLPRVSK
jgi:hypothetical protein